MANHWTPEQEAAMSIHGKTLLVSAAAGSGKTSVLTERIIRTLTDREHPADLSRMLIVTFTRASAADLKSKIAKALTAALAEHPGDTHLTKQLVSLGSAQISTIDAFFQRAVRANFDALDLPAAFRIADYSEVLPLCMGTIDNLLESHYSQSSQKKSETHDPLARIKENAFADAMDHLMSGRSDGKLDSILLEFYNRFAAYPQGISLLHTCAQRLLEDAEHEFFDSLHGKAIQNHLLEQFQSFDTFLTETINEIAPDPDLYAKFSGILCSDRDFCVAMLHALESNSYTETRNVAYTFVSGRFPTVKQEVPDCILAYKAWRNKFKDTITKKVQSYLQWPSEVIPDQFRRTAALCETLYQFYIDYEANVLTEKKARGMLEYNDIRAALYKLLTLADGSPSPAAKSIASQYDAVYIDEYQDVDFLQDSIFSQIGGNRRFMVGDIKQSIYGFRGSEPSVFAGYRRAFPLYTDEEALTSDGVCVFMSNNFRCNEPVIQFTNQVCSFLFSACEQSIGYRPQDDLVFSKSKNEDATPVQVAVFDAKPSKKQRDTEEELPESEPPYSAEAAWVAQEIETLLQTAKKDDGTPITPSDICILVRAKSHGIEFARALEVLNIPVVAEAAVNLMEEELMIDMLNLLRAIDNPYRDLPLSEYLLSPLGGFDLEELTEIRASASHSKSLFDALSEIASAEASPLQSKASKLCNRLKAWQETAATLSADRFLRLLYLEEELSTYQGDPVLLYLYEQARLYQRTAFCGLYGFLDAMTKLQNSEKVSADGFKKAEKAVTIMTVHHSKGLEYPVVFLCSTGKYFNKDDLKDSLVYHRNVGCSSKLYHPEIGETQESILRLAARLEIDAEQTEESIRTLYVALTRARERLYVTGTLGGGRESALTSAELVRRGDRSAILGCNSYLAWILAALQEKRSTQDTCYSLHFHSHVPIEFNPTNSTETQQESTDSDASETTPIAIQYANVLKAQETFSYPLAFLQGLPTKAAASKLCPDLLDRLSTENEEDDISKVQLEQMLTAQPSFEELLFSSQNPSAADIGTATHTFLQFCNFRRLAKNGVEKECAELLANGFISEIAAKIVNVEQLNTFCQSELFQEILSAKSVLREQKFNLFIPFDELTVKQERIEQLHDHTLFVQGSIDLLIETLDGDWILVDYKTDRLTTAEKKNPALFRARMKQSHANQLSYYKKAVKQLFSKEPTKTYLYSLSLGEWIEV